MAILLYGIGVLGLLIGFSPPLTMAQPVKGLNCLQCHVVRQLMAEEGCLACHEGYKKNKIVQNHQQLENLAWQIYGKGKGYECAICHEGNPSSSLKEEAHNGMFPNPGSEAVGSKGYGCSKCHFFDEIKGKMVTQIPLPKSVNAKKGRVTTESR